MTRIAQLRGVYVIKVVICDGDGTLDLPRPSPEMRELVEALPSLAIKLAVASNSRSEYYIKRRFRAARLPPPDFIVTRSDVGKPKPSPQFVYRIQELADVKLREMVYIGDDDNTDTFCAINAHVLPFVAKYSQSNKPMEYGLEVRHPKAFFKDYLTTFGKQDTPYFGWRYTSPCHDTNSPIDVRVLFGDHGHLGLTDTLVGVLKDQEDKFIGSTEVSVRHLLFHYLVSQCYLSGLTLEIDFVTVYPGHKAGSINETLQEFSHTFAPVFGDRFLSDLLIRHEDAPQSRRQGARRNIYDQFRTIRVNAKYASRIRGRGILVLDDFTTRGYSLETTRRMLLQAEAGSVVCVAIAKFGSTHSKTRISKPWNPFVPCTLEEGDIRYTDDYGRLNSLADEYFGGEIWPVYSA